jgi:subtilisin family serine protease
LNEKCWFHFGLKEDIFMRTLNLNRFVRMRYQVAVMLALLLGLLASLICAESNATAKPSPADIVRNAAAKGKLAYKLTTPEEVKALLGEPPGDDNDNNGVMEWFVMRYPAVEIHFSRFRIYKDDPLTLRSIIIRGKKVNIGGEGPPALRNANDLKKIASLKRRTSLHDISLKDLDLTDQGDYLKSLAFDTTTLWPPSEKLPAGFDPQKLLEEGKNPGLGIRALHEQGVNGKGIGIAILDQPLLLGHEEYSSRLVRYDATRADWLKLKPQMHGSPIIGIAVGKTCGVAPGAFVSYYAGMTTTVHETQADWINEIINYNKTAGDSERIRVISISASPEDASDNDAFRKARKRALDVGILVVTCSKKFLRYGTLTLIEGKDPDKPESYKGGGSDHVLLIPTSNKTIASYRGTNSYYYERKGGRSWAAPYIAGLAALAFQVNPDLQPETILEQLVKTATHTKAGPVVNPPGFIEAVQKLHLNNKQS